MVLKSKRQRAGKNDVVLSEENQSRVLNYDADPKSEAAVNNVPAFEVKVETDDVIDDTKNCTQEILLTK